MWESGCPAIGKVLQELWGIAIRRNPTANNARNNSFSGVCSRTITRTREYISITSIPAIKFTPTGTCRASPPGGLSNPVAAR